MTADTLIEFNAVSKRFCRRGDRSLRYGMQDLLRDVLVRPPRDTLRDGEFWALRDIDFSVRRGDVIGLVGHNGAGKSSLLKLLAGIYRPTLGNITVRTERIAVLDHSAGLNPMQTGRECIYTKLALLGQRRAEIAERVDAIVAVSELGHVIDAQVCTYSTGMRVRLAFAIYASVEIDIFLVDDSLGVADIRFAQRMQRYWHDFVRAGGTMLLATHEMYLMRSLCTRALLLDHGRIVSAGPTEAVISEYLLSYLPASGVETGASDAVPVPAPSVRAPAAPGQLEDPDAAGRFARFARSDAFPVEITAIELAADPAVGKGAVQALGRLTVSACCISSIAAENLLFGFEILDEQGRVIIHVRSDEAPHYTTVQGANRFAATLVNLPLMPGRYRVCVAVMEAGSKAILGMRGWEDAGEALEVLPHFRDDLLGAISRQALMTAPVIWQSGSRHEHAWPEAAVCQEALADAGDYR